MALITNLLIRSGLMKSGPDVAEQASDGPPPAQTDAPPMVLYVDDLDPETLAQLEADGLVHLEDEYIEPLDPEKPAMRVVLLGDLVAHSELNARDEKNETDLAEQLGLNASIADVLAASQLQAQAGEWSIDRALRWLEDNRDQYGTYGELARGFRAALAEVSISEDRVLSDALLRDRAIDKYERILQQQVAAQQAKLQQQRNTLLERIAGLTQEAESLAQQDAALTGQLDAWSANKAATEQRWADVINLMMPGTGESIKGNTVELDDQ